MTVIDGQPKGTVTVNGGPKLHVWRGRVSQFVTHARKVGTLNGVRYEFTPTFGTQRINGAAVVTRYFVHFMDGGESFYFCHGDTPLPVGADVRFKRG